MDIFRVIIAGGRDFQDYNLLYRKCNHLFCNRNPTCIITGGATGADTLGERYAKEKKYPSLVIHADWERYGNAAGMIRNKQMLEQAEALIAFWDKKSHGTENMIRIAQERGIFVRVIIYKR